MGTPAQASGRSGLRKVLLLLGALFAYLVVGSLAFVIPASYHACGRPVRIRITHRVNLFDRPSVINVKVLRTLEVGQHCKLVQTRGEKDRSYYRIRLDDGTEGYVVQEGVEFFEFVDPKKSLSDVPGCSPVPRQWP